MGMQYGSDKNLNVDVVSLPPLPAGSNGIGTMSLTGSLPAGSNAIGSVTSNDGGAPITGATIPAGGSGLLGWLSAVWSRLANIASLNFTGSNLNVNLAAGAPTSPANYGATSTASVPSNSTTAVKGSAGRLFALAVTTLGTAGVGLTFTDGPGGVILAVVPPNVLGDVPLYGNDNGRPFSTSLVPTGAVGSPVVTVIYS